jgi:hypothetical protein
MSVTAEESAGATAIRAFHVDIPDEALDDPRRSDRRANRSEGAARTMCAPSYSAIRDTKKRHQLIRQPQPTADKLFEFLDSGVEAFAFTFG